MASRLRLLSRLRDWLQRRRTPLSTPPVPSPPAATATDPSPVAPVVVDTPSTAPAVPYHPPIRRADYPRTAFASEILPAEGSYQRQHSSSGVTWAIDLAVSVGSRIYAHADGVVERVSDVSDPYNGIGVWVVADTGLLADIPVASIHLSHRLVEVGDLVQRGQLIGFSGDTGDSDGPHLHWEIGALVDPMTRDLFDWTGAGW